jgi:protein disulfide-isomerase A6
MYKSLAIDLQGRMILAQVRDTNKKVLEEFNVDKFPTLLVLPGGSTPGIVYSSELKRNPMYEFLAEYAPDATLRTPSAQPRLRKPTADYTPKKITEISDFIPFCFDAGTCFLFLSSQEEHLKTFSAVNQRLNAKKNLHIYTTELFEGKEDLFGWEKMPAVIALNGKKGWFKTYDGEIVERDIAEWIDGVKMGDGKKIKIGDEVKGLLGFSKSTSSKSSETTTSQSTDEGVEKPATEGVEEIFGEEKEAIHDEL